MGKRRKRREERLTLRNAFTSTYYYVYTSITLTSMVVDLIWRYIAVADGGSR